ncbi:hypothetical protein EK21DRAFT_116864 [Setomelanomma holmii]|uniref:Uncharacterized protein n=1 Tax=Setomelanomma holmii TaxID=210430 RepID=A0A9P4H1M0_9PLEO|nr:hypothetical protein EK21DRAFT_116864 [Setomelanomma holmii]
MRFIAVTTAFILGATALPATGEERPSNVLALAQNVPADFSPVDCIAAPFTNVATKKRGAGGEGLATSIPSGARTCYNLEREWNNEISSLSVPHGAKCRFYVFENCDDDTCWLTVAGEYRVDGMEKYAIDDMVTSYLCWD